MMTVAVGMTAQQNKSSRHDDNLIDQRLIERVAKNLDREAFADLFDRLAPKVKSFIMRKGASAEMAEDLVQETMISVWTKAGLYNAEKGSAVTWIFTIARNLRIDRLRRESSMQLSDLGDYDAPSDDVPSDDVLSRKQETRLVAAALAEIPQEQRDVLLLSYVEDIPQSEIAVRLNIPLGTVKSRMRLAYGRLKKTLETLN